MRRLRLALAALAVSACDGRFDGPAAGTRSRS